MRRKNQSPLFSERVLTIEKGGDNSLVFQDGWGSPVNQQEPNYQSKQDKFETSVIRQKTRRHSDSRLHSNILQNKQHAATQDFEYIKSKWFEAGATYKVKATLFKQVHTRMFYKDEQMF
jgi:hypothetical protein